MSCDAISNFYFPYGCCEDSICDPCERYSDDCCVEGKFWRLPVHLAIAGGITLLVLSILAMTNQAAFLSQPLHQPFFFTGVVITGLALLGLVHHYFLTTCDETKQME